VTIIICSCNLESLEMDHWEKWCNLRWSVDLNVVRSPVKCVSSTIDTLVICKVV
jgi:hypothetical protein